tara:strand:+ start:69 stop:188 length:120 start_codon:yes stop_codon:yes gene_type:complete
MPVRGSPGLLAEYGGVRGYMDMCRGRRPWPTETSDAAAA